MVDLQRSLHIYSSIKNNDDWKKTMTAKQGKKLLLICPSETSSRQRLSYGTSRVKKICSFLLRSEFPSILDFVSQPEFLEVWFLFTATYPLSPLFSENIWFYCFDKDWDPHSIYGNDNSV